MERGKFDGKYRRIIFTGRNAMLRLRAASSIGFPYNIEIVAENLFVPWAIDQSDDGRLFFTERSGTVRVIENMELKSEPVYTFKSPFVSSGEGGLLGIALDPEFMQNHYIYVYHTYTEGGKTYNRVVRLLEQDNTASFDQVIIDKIPGGRVHDGGRIKIGPDGKLYITTGDAGTAEAAQDIDNLSGKILRFNLDGGIPEDNPFHNSPVYSLGFRNPQGLAWNKNNVLYASEHGPTAHDEINLILPGSNYGWPLVQDGEDYREAQLQLPVIQSGNVTWAPSGITFADRGPWQGRLLVSTLRGQRLLVITLNEEGTAVENVEDWLQDSYGRLREAYRAKDGSIYLTTSNRDGRGEGTKGDDKIIRLIPIEIEQ